MSATNKKKPVNKKLDREAIAQQIIKRAPGPVISRPEAWRLSGYEIAPTTFRNLDSLGKGPGGRVKIGRRVGYRTEAFARWLAERIELV